MSASDSHSTKLPTIRPFRAVTALLIVGMLVSLSLAVLAYLRVPDVAYIDTSVLMERYDKAVAVRQEISAKQAEWNENVQTLKTELGELNQELVQEGAQWGEEKRQTMQDTLEERKRELQRYGRAIRKKTEKLRRDAMKPVYSELNADIKAFGKENGYDLILGTLQGGNILFAEEATDVTERFLDHVNSGEDAAEELGSGAGEVAEAQEEKK